jgi:uncharacterized protein (TIGR03083 family)
MQGNPFDELDAEARRVDDFYARLGPDEWREPTRCAGWDRADLLAHLVGIEDYTRACLDDRVDEYAKQAGDVGYERLNEVLVERRRGTPGAQLLAEWRAKVAENHRRLRERGTDATLATSAGPYPLGRQAWYLACELAIHADDAGVPVPEAARSARLAWRSAFGLDALHEVHPEVTVDTTDGFRIGSTVLSEEEFVEATSGRLDSRPELRALA